MCASTRALQPTLGTCNRLVCHSQRTSILCPSVAMASCKLAKSCTQQNKSKKTAQVDTVKTKHFGHVRSGAACRGRAFSRKPVSWTRRSWLRCTLSWQPCAVLLQYKPCMSAAGAHTWCQRVRSLLAGTHSAMAMTLAKV